VAAPPVFFLAIPLPTSRNCSCVCDLSGLWFAYPLQALAELLSTDAALFDEPLPLRRCKQLVLRKDQLGAAFAKLINPLCQCLGVSGRLRRHSSAFSAKVGRYCSLETSRGNTPGWLQPQPALATGTGPWNRSRTMMLIRATAAAATNPATNQRRHLEGRGDGISRTGRSEGLSASDSLSRAQPTSVSFVNSSDSRSAIRIDRVSVRRHLRLSRYQFWTAAMAR
jgi:hypothetical protein